MTHITQRSALQNVDPNIHAQFCKCGACNPRQIGDAASWFSGFLVTMTCGFLVAAIFAINLLILS